MMTRMMKKPHIHLPLHKASGLQLSKAIAIKMIADVPALLTLRAADYSAYFDLGSANSRMKTHWQRVGNRLGTAVSKVNSELAKDHGLLIQNNAGVWIGNEGEMSGKHRQAIGQKHPGRRKQSSPV
jgi:hypothetical protein